MQVALFLLVRISDKLPTLVYDLSTYTIWNAIYLSLY